MKEYNSAPFEVVAFFFINKNINKQLHFRETSVYLPKGVKRT